MKHLLSLTAIVIFFSACTKENSPAPQNSQDYSVTQWMNDEKIARSEIHIAILSFNKGEASFGTKKYTFHLSPNYLDPLVMDSDTIVRQLWHVNDVLNYGVSQQKHTYPYTNYLGNNYNGNNIAEIPISIKLVADTAAAKDWIIRVSDNGYAPHTHFEYHTPNDYAKIIYPNL